jgi:ATP-dependent DNA helicase
MGELWALLNFLQPDIFDDHEIFESWFNARSLHMDEDEKAWLEAQEEEKNVLASIHRIIGPFMLRRVKAEVELTIPPKTEVLVYCPFTEAQAGQYHMFQRLLVRTKAKAAKEEPMLGGNLGRYSMQYMNDLRSAVNHPYILSDPGTRDQAMIDCCGKLQVLDQMLTRLMQDGHKTLVFSQMTRLLDVICDYLKMKNIPYCLLDGRTPYLDRQMYVERFTSDPEVMVFLLSTRAGGLGINLVAADTCIIYDSDWNPQQDLQAQDRCHRIGQTKPVMVYRLVTKGTIDQVMVERAQAKRALERLVVHKDMFKSGAKSLQSAGRKIESGEILRMILAGEVSASCTAEQEAGGLEQEVLDRIMDRGNVQQGSEMTAGNMENNNVKLAKKLAKKVGTNLY